MLKNCKIKKKIPFENIESTFKSRIHYELFSQFTILVTSRNQYYQVYKSICLQTKINERPVTNFKLKNLKKKPKYLLNSIIV